MSMKRGKNSAEQVSDSRGMAWPAREVLGNRPGLAVAARQKAELHLAMPGQAGSSGAPQLERRTGDWPGLWNKTCASAHKSPLTRTDKAG